MLEVKLLLDITVNAFFHTDLNICVYYHLLLSAKIKIRDQRVHSLFKTEWVPENMIQAIIKTFGILWRLRTHTLSIFNTILFKNGEVIALINIDKLHKTFMQKQIKTIPITSSN